MDSTDEALLIIITIMNEAFAENILFSWSVNWNKVWWNYWLGIFLYCLYGISWTLCLFFAHTLVWIGLSSQVLVFFCVQCVSYSRDRLFTHLLMGNVNYYGHFIVFLSIWPIRCKTKPSSCFVNCRIFPLFVSTQASIRDWTGTLFI